LHLLKPQSLSSSSSHIDKLAPPYFGIIYFDKDTSAIRSGQSINKAWLRAEAFEQDLVSLGKPVFLQVAAEEIKTTYLCARPCEYQITAQQSAQFASMNLRIAISFYGINLRVYT